MFCKMIQKNHREVTAISASGGGGSASDAQQSRFVDCFGPVVPQEPRQRTIGQKLSVSLTAGTVVAFVVGVDNALNRCTADRARLSKFSMRGHFSMERRHVFGESTCGLAAQPCDPFRQDVACRLVQYRYFFFRQPAGPFQWREPRAVKDFIRVRVADPAEQSWIGQGAFYGMIFPEERAAEFLLG